MLSLIVRRESHAIPTRLLRAATPICQSYQQRCFSASTKRLDEPDFAAARTWYAQAGSTPIVKEIGEVSYARSSGPGGQNVNK